MPVANKSAKPAPSLLVDAERRAKDRSELAMGVIGLGGEGGGLRERVLDGQER